VDDRNGNPDIYLTEVSYTTIIGGPPLTPTPEYAITRIENIKNIIADPSQIPPSDISGNNRRDTLLNKIDSIIYDIQDAADSTNTKKQKALYQSALDQFNSILEKTDGYLSRGTPDSNGSGSHLTG
jgi:hypothetical protein